MDRSPSSKLRQLLPRGAAVRLVKLDDVTATASPNSKKNDTGKTSTSASTTPRYWIVRQKDDVLVNEELVRSGFAFVRKNTKGAAPSTTSTVSSEMMNDLIALERTAKNGGLGIYKSCSEDNTVGTMNNDGSESNKNNNVVQSSNFVAEFEPLDYTTEIRYGDDGGKSFVVSRKDYDSSSSGIPPPNPGDIKGCSDFATYEDALGWYETYAPYYGDVAKLDRDGDGVPCPGLPHTAVAERYRMKVPKKVVDGR